MCGRYYIADENQEAEIKKILNRMDASQRNMLKSGEIFPTYHAPVLKAADQVKLLSWGYPKWGAKGVVINARSETAREKSMFGKSLRERRCAVPANGFYERQRRDASKPKSKFLFTSDQGPVMYFAGIWKSYKDEEFERFVILTRDANISMVDIHDRMPVVLFEHEVQSWVEDDKFVDFALHRDNIVLKRQEVV